MSNNNGNDEGKRGPPPEGWARDKTDFPDVIEMNTPGPAGPVGAVIDAIRRLLTGK